MQNIKVDDALWASSMAPEGVVERWLIADGGAVIAGDPIAAIRIEDSLHEIISPTTGRLKIVAGVNAVVEPGALLARLADESPDLELETKILAVLDENRIMAVATVRPDGWPQATFVGYARDGLTLYFAVAANSQKFDNIKREPRVSIAIGHDSPHRIHGLSMAAMASVVTDIAEVRRLNDVINQRYPEQIVFAPREASSALMRATPMIISLIDHSKGPGQPEALQVAGATAVRRFG